MTKEEFTRQLRNATECAIAFSKRYVTNSFSDAIIYDIHYNCSQDAGAERHFLTYPGDAGKILKKARVILPSSGTMECGKIA